MVTALLVSGMLTPLSVLALGGLTSTPLGTLLLALLAVTAIVLVGRIVLSVAWKLLVVATVVVGAAWAVTALLG